MGEDRSRSSAAEESEIDIADYYISHEGWKASSFHYDGAQPRATEGDESDKGAANGRYYGGVEGPRLMRRVTAAGTASVVVTPWHLSSGPPMVVVHISAGKTVN